MARWGRQAGKSTACNNELLRYAWENPGCTLWFISPTHAQAKVQYRRMISTLWKSKEILLKKSQTELRVKLINMAQIKFVSGETFDNLRGETLHGVVIDEVRQQHPDLWPLVIRPMLSTTKGWAAFVSTPNGFDSFYDLFEQAREDKTGKWACFSAPSTANPLFTDEEYQAAKRDMSEGQFAQEILAEFRDITSGKAYVNYGEHNLLEYNPFCKPGSDNPLVHPSLPIVVGLDFNLSPMAWTLGQKRVEEFYWYDEVWLEGSHTQEAALELVSRVRGHKPGIILCGDATGNAGQRAIAGQSDYDILCKVLNDNGILWRNETPASNPPVKDRINTFNSKLKSADGITRMWLNPTGCPRLKKDLERVVWKTSSNGTTATLDQTKDTTLTHSSDGVGYVLCALSPLQGVNDVGTLKLIRR